MDISLESKIPILHPLPHIKYLICLQQNILPPFASMNQLSEFAAVVRKGEELQQAEAETRRHAANFLVVCTPGPS